MHYSFTLYPKGVNKICSIILVPGSYRDQNKIPSKTIIAYRPQNAYCCKTIKDITHEQS